MTTNRAWQFLAWLAVAIAGTLFFDDVAHATAPQVSSFSPASGTIGTKVTITGTAFTAASAVKFNSAPASSFTVNSATKITATAPTTVSTGTISITTPGGTGKSTTSFTVTPGLQLSAGSGHPRSTLTASGAGFHPSVAVDVYFDTTDLALAVSTGKGLVSVPIEIPASAQPGQHWITLVERGTNQSAQDGLTVTTSWPMIGFNGHERGYNLYENSISASNVNSLTDTWSAPAGGFSNSSPFVTLGGTMFVGDATGHIHAYSRSGSLLWSAFPSTDLESVTPVAYAGKVFFGASNGNVYAYNAACRTDGGVCTPLWTTSVGTSVTSSLTQFGGMIYAPSNDGSIHPLNPANGTPGTPIFGFDTAHGAVTTPVTFGPDGAFYYGTGNYFQNRDAFGGSTVVTETGAVSPVAVYNDAAYFTDGDGKIYQRGGGTAWSAVTSGSGCAPAPVVANDIVYAGGCSTLTAFAAGNGAVQWTVTTPGAVIGLSVANGVVYGCINSGGAGIIIAYAASYGGRLWKGGYCTAAPVIVDATVYSTYARAKTYNLPGADPNRTTARPSPSALRPDHRLLKQPYRPTPLIDPEE